MRRLLAAALLAISVVALSAAAEDDTFPLTVSIAADPLLLERFKSQTELEDYLLDLINRASLIFQADTGRRLALGVVEIGLPPGTSFSIDDTSAFAWLAEKLQHQPARFWVFLIDRPLASCVIPGAWAGCGMMNDSRSIVVYASDLTVTLQNLLHEIGHNCGADHSESKESIMYPSSRNATSYGDKAGVIREKCG